MFPNVFREIFKVILEYIDTYIFDVLSSFLPYFLLRFKFIAQKAICYYSSVVTNCFLYIACVINEALLLLIFPLQLITHHRTMYSGVLFKHFYHVIISNKKCIWPRRQKCVWFNVFYHQKKRNKTKLSLDFQLVKLVLRIQTCP